VGKRKGDSLGFALHTSADFKYFQQVMEEDLSNMIWLHKTSDEDDQDEDVN
jgi:hypothetical protein